MRHIQTAVVPLLPAAALALVGAAAPSGTLDIAIDNLRNERGVLHVCLTREAGHFPDCSSDPAAVKRTVFSDSKIIRIAGLAPGTYALSIVHDENNNGKLDTFVGIPREGFGFSRNPVIRFGAPEFRQVHIDLGPGLARQTVRMRYLL